MMMDPKGLKDALERGRRVVIFTHDNPDPDAIAAAWLLSHIADSLGVPATIVYGGSLSRAENRAMVRLLEVPVEPFDRQAFRPAKTHRYALVDTQPGAENNSFPDGVEAHVVIDHHPRRSDLAAEFVDVRLDEGCCTTMMLGYHRAFGLELSSAMATAAFYAIISDTQDLDRAAAKADVDACQLLFPLVQLDQLGRLRHAPRDRDYYRAVARAMRHVLVGKNTCVCHIGPVASEGVVAEVADFLVAMKQVTWCLVSGLHEGAAILSLRTTHPEGTADQLMRSILRGIGAGGGHGMVAGGAARCGDLAAYRALMDRVTERFLDGLPRRQPENLRPLLDEETEEPRLKLSVGGAD